MKELILGQNTKIIVRRVYETSNDEGKFHIDARVWIKFPNNQDFIPVRKGLYLYPETWERVIKAVQEHIAGEVDEDVSSQGE